jgi:hypothetical protein
MYIDPNKYYADGTLVQDPTRVINTIPDLNSNAYHQGGVFSTSTPFNDPWENPMKEIQERMDKLELENRFLRLKILGMEGKFSQDEIKNIRAMLMSNDEASITLAETIIETA